MFAMAIKDREFKLFREMIYSIAGIDLSDAKKAMVSGRLARRLRHHQLTSFGDYFRMISDGDRDELQVAVDLLTTNETHFFREPRHFDFLRERLNERRAAGRPVRVWSAASSSGEEPYSIAMTLEGVLGSEPWEVIGSDISMRVLERAREGIYAEERIKGIVPSLLRAYFLKGVGSQAGKYQVVPELRKRVRYSQINLNAPLPNLGKFDFIFLRNVMIYFNAETKQQVVARMLPMLAPGGYFLVGHAESLNGLATGLNLLRPSIYQAVSRDSRCRPDS
jgi:chemotaxis protein methyltransferase CheR